MTINHRQFAIAGLFATLLFVSITNYQSAYAIERESITLSPTLKRIDAERGQQVNGDFTIINDGTVDYDFTVYAAPYSVKNQEYTADFTTDKPRSDVYKWVQLVQTKYHLKAQEKVTVPYVVHVPASTAAGSHYGVIFAETQPSADQTLGRKNAWA